MRIQWALLNGLALALATVVPQPATHHETSARAHGQVVDTTRAMSVGASVTLGNNVSLTTDGSFTIAAVAAHTHLHLVVGNSKSVVSGSVTATVAGHTFTLDFASPSGTHGWGAA
jgi:hypothetical protein